MKKITIIMPFLNEGMEPFETLQSIYNTADSSLFNIIAIDDCSDKVIVDLQSYFKNITVIRNNQRMGVDWCRQKGADLAETPFIFIIDAHMRFKKDNWLNVIIDCLEKEPTTAWCTTCLGLGYGKMDINQNLGKYYGATMLFIDPNFNPNRPSRECLEPKWANKKEGIEYEIPCILGANYGFSKQWFNYIRGLRGLKSWGSSEPFLSLKTWFAGGKCKIRTDIEIGHKFRDNAPYTTQISDLYYNKLYICSTILPLDVSKKIIDCLPKNINYKKAVLELEKNKEFINESRQYYNSIFKYNIKEYCERFNLYLP